MGKDESASPYDSAYDLSGLEPGGKKLRDGTPDAPELPSKVPLVQKNALERQFVCTQCGGATELVVASSGLRVLCRPCKGNWPAGGHVVSIGQPARVTNPRSIDPVVSSPAGYEED